MFPKQTKCIHNVDKVIVLLCIWTHSNIKKLQSINQTNVPDNYMMQFIKICIQNEKKERKKNSTLAVLSNNFRAQPLYKKRSQTKNNNSKLKTTFYYYDDVV